MSITVERVDYSEVLIGEQQLPSRIVVPGQLIMEREVELGGEIAGDMVTGTTGLHVITIDEGARQFGPALANAIQGNVRVPITGDSMRLSTYSDTASSATIRCWRGLDSPEMVDGSDVLIAVGAVRKGATLNWLDTVIGNLGAKSIRYATLLHVNGEGVEPEELTRSRAYVGFTVNRMSDFEHYVGRGLGYRGGARNYPDIHAFDRRELNVVKAQQ